MLNPTLIIKPTLIMLILEIEVKIIGTTLHLLLTRDLTVVDHVPEISPFEAEEQVSTRTKSLQTTRKTDFKNNIRPFTSQQFHQLSFLQNVNFKTDKDITSSKSLYNINRPKGRVLARTYNTKEETLSRVRIPEHQVSIQSHVIWPKYCSKNIHQLISHVSNLVAQKGIYMLVYLDNLLIITPILLQCFQDLMTVVDILYL